jgi:hypothetical protein
LALQSDYVALQQELAGAKSTIATLTNRIVALESKTQLSVVSAKNGSSERYAVVTCPSQGFTINCVNRSTLVNTILVCICLLLLLLH